MLDSVAILRVVTSLLSKWYYFYKIKSKFINLQSGSNTSKEITLSSTNAKFENSLRKYKKICSDSFAYSATILSFFLKSLYFHTGYGDLISYFREEWWLIPNVIHFDSLKKVIHNILYVNLLVRHLSE